MDKLTGHIYEEFLNTLKLCSSKILELPDSEIEYVILEDLDIAYFSVFHESTLDYLLLNKLINKEVYRQVLDLRSRIQNTIQIEGKRNVIAFRHDVKWLEIYAKSDLILQEIGSII